jgi:tetratricopeptide (TPR) repeat protein
VIARGFVVVLGAWLVATSFASAQESTEIEQPAETEEPSEVEAPSDTDAEARRLFEEGEQLYTDGQFQEALEKFRRAYDLSGRVGLLYNIGISAMNIGEDRQALESFEAYLEGLPGAPNRALVEGRIATLQRRLQSESESERRLSEAEARARASRDEPSSPVPGWVLVGVGGAVAIAGGVLFALGLSDLSTVEDAGEGTPWSDLSDANDRAPVFTGIGIAGASAGLAVVALGLVLVATSGGGDEEVAVGPGVVRGRF